MPPPKPPSTSPSNKFSLVVLLENGSFLQEFFLLVFRQIDLAGLDGDVLAGRVQNPFVNFAEIPVADFFPQNDVVVPRGED